MDVVVVAEQVLFLYTGESWVMLRKGDGVNGGNDTVESDFTLVHVLLKLQRQIVHAEKSYKIDKKYL